MLTHRAVYTSVATPMRVHLHISLPAELVALLDEYAKSRYQNRSAAIQELVRVAVAAPVVTEADPWDVVSPVETPPEAKMSYEDLVALGRLKPALQPGERRIEYDGERKR
jgi:hypothetical protein